jgi:hypothetical protein
VTTGRSTKRFLPQKNNFQSFCDAAVQHFSSSDLISLFHALNRFAVRAIWIRKEYGHSQRAIQWKMRISEWSSLLGVNKKNRLSSALQEIEINCIRFF